MWKCVGGANCSSNDEGESETDALAGARAPRVGRMRQEGLCGLSCALWSSQPLPVQ